MVRTFDGFLYDLIDGGRHIVMTNNGFLSNARANIIKAFALIESSPANREIEWTVEQAWINLLKTYSASLFYSSRRAVEFATKLFVGKIELLR